MRQPAAPTAVSSARATAIDGGLALAVAVSTVAYLAALPRNLGTADESYFLLEAKRLLQGQVLYRDVFYYATPGAHWLMAALFRVFGVDLAVARLTVATLHGLTAALLFASARRLGVHRGLALVVPLAYVALAQPAWPYASYHWFSTLLTVLLLFVLLGRPLAARATWWWRPGLLVGALASIQQQKAAAMGAGVVALLVLDWLMDRRVLSRATLMASLIRLGAGGLVVFGPVLAAVLDTAGWRPVWHQLVVYPLTDYRTLNHSGWGDVHLFNLALAQYTVPVLLACLPAIAGVTALRALWLWRRAGDVERLRRVLTLLVMSLAAALSIAYLPDFIHLAFIAPFGLLCAAEGLDACGRALARQSERAPAWRSAASAALGVPLLILLVYNYKRAYEEFPLRYQTAFGRVDFATAQEIALVERVRGLLHDVPTREFFAYPVYTSLYLTTGADNPTPNQVLILGHSSWRQMAHAADILRAHRLPYVFTCRWPSAPVEPVREYLDAAYEPTPPTYHFGGIDCAILQRKSTDEHG